MDVSLISNQVEQKFGDACSRIYGEFADSTSRALQQYFQDFTTKACSLLQNGFAEVVIASQNAFERCCREAIEDSVTAMRAEFGASLRRSLDAASESLASKFHEESLAEAKELETAKNLLKGELSDSAGYKMEEVEQDEIEATIPETAEEPGPSASLFEEALKTFNAADFAALTKQAELMATGDLLSPPPSVPLPLPLPPPSSSTSPSRPSARRVHSCSFCGIRFSLRSQLRRHLRSHLSGAASGEQNATIDGSAAVSGHLPTVSDAAAKDEAGASGTEPPAAGASLERPFACDLCGRAFNKRWNLTAHLRIHTDERPFVCEACGKAFRRKSCLVIHKRSHSRERPFSCGVCGKSFADGSSRNKHQRLHMWLEQPMFMDNASGSV